MPLRLIEDAGNADNTDKRPLLVSISAHALSSVGFGLSIIAIWMHWLFPPCNELEQDQLIHRQPARNGHRQPSPPPSSRAAHSPIHTKRVSFADAKKRHHATRRAVAPNPDVAAPNPHPVVPDGLPVVISVPRCKSPQPIADDVTAPTTPTSSSSTIVQSVDEKKKDGDPLSLSSPSPIPSKSSPPTGAAQKSDGFFARRNPCKKRRTGSLSEKSLEPSQTRERCSRATSLKSPLEKLSSRALPRSATFSFGTRHSRPVPRTMPYGPPYFATPPLPIDDAPSDSRKVRRNATVGD
ncbi:hypothetical protein JOM56_006591 [Amanita muscaria]